MFSHLPELVIIMIIGLIVFGPEKLPEMAGNVGKMIREVRQQMDAALNPYDPPANEDFSAHFMESMARNGETIPPAPGDTELTGIWPGVAGAEHVEMAMGQPTQEVMPESIDLSFFHPDTVHDASLPHDATVPIEPLNVDDASLPSAEPIDPPPKKAS